MADILDVHDVRHDHDSVGVIIPEVIKEFHLSMTVGGAFHYAAMSGIAFAGFFLGYLADKFGRKKSIILGLVLFALNSYLFAVGRSFAFFRSPAGDFRSRNRHF